MSGAREPRLDAAVRARIPRLAEDFGRLRRHVDGSDQPGADYLRFLLDRLAGHVLTLDAMLGPCASELLLVAGFDDAAVEVTLAAVDERDAELERLLGCRGGT